MLKAMLNLINQQKQKSKKGFTLVELIVVIAILGILAALVVPSVSGYIKKAQDATNQANAEMLYAAAQLYVTDQEVAGNSFTTGDKITVDQLYKAGYLQKAFDETKLGKVDIVVTDQTITGVGGTTGKNYTKTSVELVYTALTGSKSTYTLGKSTT